MSPEPRALVSIVIPFYSHPEYLTQALESALGQTYPAIEVLLVDDGSPHDLDPILQPYQRDARLRVIHQENAGVAAARNTGIAASRGVYLQFLDSDDWLAPEKIERHVDALEAQPDIGLVFCPFRFVEDDAISDPINPVHDPIWQAEDGRYFNTLWAANRMVMAGPLVRREWIERAGGFDTSNLTEDYELWLRLAAMGCLFQNLPDALVYYRINQQGRSQDGRARTRKVATRTRILTLYPEQVAEATERAMETWQTSYDALWHTRQETLNRQAGELAQAKQLWDELHEWSTKLQRTVNDQAAELSRAKEHWDGLHEWSKALQQTIDRQAEELAQAKLDWEGLHDWSTQLRETVDRQAEELKEIREQRDALHDWSVAQRDTIEQLMTQHDSRKRPFAHIRKMAGERPDAASMNDTSHSSGRGRHHSD